MKKEEKWYKGDTLFFSMSFVPFASLAIKIPQKDIDTDLIIPAKFLKVTTQEGLRDGCFFEFKKDPHFPMNLPKYKDAQIVIAGANFGCGSSREHAPWALNQNNISVIIASEFADIFRGNAEKNGILPIILSEEIVQEFLTNDSLKEFSIDLPAQKVRDEQGNEFSFKISAFAKKRLLENLSDADYLAEMLPKIRAFEEKRSPLLPLISV